ncbi:glycoside hydrolase family 44 protein [Actomonas aquatica]|uniref:Glycoside hydrolase family 44 protein n=1 Tax=Actomonas aquatica TaxID=2866162 RepID=A0ABZ1C6T4_9BACT|nr:glycoside hydrolase family 44 protein [Opitutus sp. WL0086]WRQ86244.1 glycoside hydrolase family 44 protein [Opitutus sp. WL0086]
MSQRTPFRTVLVAMLLPWASTVVSAQSVSIAIDVTQDRLPVSPYLYGKNDTPGQPGNLRTAADWTRFRDSGLRMMRTLGGNNGTKYNWQKKLSSHPDWYNNVYANDWDFAQTQLQQNLPGVQSLWGFQLLGKVADNADHNFNEWNYNQAQWWTGVAQNLAGGGVPNSAGGHDAQQEGDPALYLTDSDAATSTAILEHWISPDGLGLDRSQFVYWSMDNEPEIWEGTHDDVMPDQLSPEAFMQRYFAYAKAARARYPDIKLTGPVAANEWQWYNWADPITVDGRNYPWLEYFIKRVGEEQARTGIRLLDVLDIHYYPSTTTPAEIVQVHRTFFDEDYVSPDANGVHAINGGWDTSINNEYIFGRCNAWLDQYLGANHGVTLGLTEIDIAVTDAPLASVWYASMIGTFMEHGVEIFTPWSWQPGMWEVMHLFANYNGDVTARATSTNEELVSAYATTDSTTGALTIVLVNRALDSSTSTRVALNTPSISDGVYAVRQLANLPADETFVSASNNALVIGSAMVSGNAFNLTLPALSVSSITLPGAVTPTPTTSGPSRLTNVSVRAVSGAGVNALTVGFVVGGSGNKEVLLRGIGPTLEDFFIAGFLPDPVMDLSRPSATPFETNDNWADNATAIANASSQLGAFALDESSLDAGLLTTLEPGPYTARIGDANDETGVVLGEAYETDAASPARLTNISARTWMGTGSDTLVAGFVITGTDPQTVLVRAIGPTLAQWSIRGVMNDPVLRIFGQSASVPLYQNDDWGDVAYSNEIAAAAQSVGAFPLPAGSADSTLLITLPPGVYSAIVAGAGDTTGIALVEVYEID